MKTLFDFVTHIKGIEYILAILFITGYILYAEILKPKPFKGLIETGRDDLNHLKQRGYREVVGTLGKVISAPFIGLAYIVILPFAFLFALGGVMVNGVVSLLGRIAIFGWRPTEAYLVGKKRRIKKEESEKKD